MTDREKLMAALDAVGIPYDAELDGDIYLEEKGRSKGKARGYSGFFLRFVFQPDGEFEHYWVGE